MSAATVEERLRLFLLAVTGCICIGTVVELWFTEHTESTLQYVPFVLCGVGLFAVLAVLVYPRRNVLLGLRIVMVIVGLGAFLGMYEHVEGNYALELEIRPNTSRGEAFWEALSGANPLLAPGILALAAALAIAATYRHPALERPADN